MHNVKKYSQAASILLAAAILSCTPLARAASTLDFSGIGTLSPLIVGPDPLSLSGTTVSFTGFIDESANPTACPAGLPVTPTVCYAIPANQLTGQIGALPLITVVTPSTLGIIYSTTGPDVLELQFGILTYSVTAILQLHTGSFTSSILMHPVPFTPSPLNLTAATSVPPPITSSSVEYCSGTCTPSTATWLGLSGSTAASAPQLTTLLSFSGTNGASPYSGMVFDKNGALYGTTQIGGASNLGGVFRLTPPAVAGGAWTQTVLHSFVGADGTNPYGALVFGKNNILYGTTNVGGTSNLGVVFQLSPPAAGGSAWTETILHNFTGSHDGANPYAGVVFGKTGALYGTTKAGGTSNLGVVFQLSPPAGGTGPWTETILHTFTGGSDGANPQDSVVFDPNGALYATTVKGGASNDGTIFQLTPPAAHGAPWTETILHSFSGYDGANPQASLILDATGALYGTTFSGGQFANGTAFQLKPPTVAGGAWTEFVLHGFSGVDGANPQAALIFDAHGNLDGTTGRGGVTNNGTVFQLQPPITPGSWIGTVLHSFGGTDGTNPQGAVVFDKNGLLYSTTVRGGASNHGTVLRLKP